MSYLVNPYMVSASGGDGWGTAQTDGIIMGGSDVGSMAAGNFNQGWSGTAWSSLATTNLTARTMTVGGGNQSAAILAGGDTNSGGNWGTSPSSVCQTWTPSSFTTVNSLNVATWGAGGGTPSTAIVCCGTYSAIDTNQTYNGDTWTTEAESYPSGSRDQAADGNAQDAFFVGGYDGSYTADTYSWNGVSWTGGSPNPDGAVSVQEGSACGQLANFSFFSVSTATGTANFYDGTTWTLSPADTNYGRRSACGGDNSYFFKANTDDNSGNTEYFNGVTFTTSGSMATAVRSGGNGANI